MASKRTVGVVGEQETVATAEVTVSTNEQSEGSPLIESPVSDECYAFLVQSEFMSIGPPCTRTLLRKLRALGFTKSNPAKRIRFVLQSYGGDADAAFKLVRAMRECCKALDVIVPESAKSAATLMTLAGDRIFMAIDSELGPLDMQLEHPMGERISSALDGTRCLEDLQRSAIMMARQLVLSQGNTFWQHSRIRRKEAFEGLLKFASDTIEPIMRQIDPWMLHECIRLLDTTERYAHTLLREYMFAPSGDDADISGNGLQLAKKIASRLVTDYPIHSYVILRDEARNDLKLKIEDAENLEDWDAIRGICDSILSEERCLCTVSLLPLDVEMIVGDSRSYRHVQT